MNRWIAPLVLLLFILMLTRPAVAAERKSRFGRPRPSGDPDVDRWIDLVDAVSSSHDVDPALAMAVLRQESRGNPNAKRVEDPKRFSAGLFQILNTTAREILPSVTDADLFNASVNAELGIEYLARQLRRYKGDVPRAVAAYNAGSALIFDKGQIVHADDGRIQYRTSFRGFPIRTLPEYKEGAFVNQKYVDSVLKFYAGFSSPA